MERGGADDRGRTDGVSGRAPGERTDRGAVGAEGGGGRTSGRESLAGDTTVGPADRPGAGSRVGAGGGVDRTSGRESLAGDTTVGAADRPGVVSRVGAVTTDRLSRAGGGGAVSRPTIRGDRSVVRGASTVRPTRGTVITFGVEAGLSIARSPPAAGGGVERVRTPSEPGRSAGVPGLCLREGTSTTRGRADGGASIVLPTRGVSPAFPTDGVPLKLVRPRAPGSGRAGLVAPLPPADTCVRARIAAGSLKSLGRPPRKPSTTWREGLVKFVGPPPRLPPKSSWRTTVIPRRSTSLIMVVLLLITTRLSIMVVPPRGPRGAQPTWPLP